MNSTTNDLLADRHLGYATFEDYVDWAVSCLESGIDSKNIRVLASLQKPLYPSEVDDYFARSLKDLGWKLPDRRECLIEYTRGFAERILSGAVSPLDGCRRIYRVVAALQYPRELESWIFLDEGLEPGTYFELQGADWDRAIVREAKRLLEEIATFDLDDSSL